MSDNKTAPATPAPAKTPSKQNSSESHTSWLQWVFSPGIGNGVINFSRVCCIACIVFLTYMTIFHYSIHYAIMSVLAACLFFSFEFFVHELRKNPEIMNPSRAKTD